MPESEAMEAMGAGSKTTTTDATRYAARLDRELARLSSIESVLDRGLGHALREMRQGRRYRRLGFELWRGLRPRAGGG